MTDILATLEFNVVHSQHEPLTKAILAQAAAEIRRLASTRSARCEALETALRALLRSHRVLTHTAASKGPPGMRPKPHYAVFIDGNQVTQPKLRLEARHDCEDLLVTAIVKLFEEPADV